ncbi:MAG: GFA family protein [Rudaea sp.]
MSYVGSCHCGDIAFRVSGTIVGVMSCNCSLCQRKGALMWFVPRPDLQLLTPDANASTYTFNKHVIKHRFCPRCGVHPYGEGIDPAGDPMAAINVRCLDGIDLEALPVTHFDGRSR